MSKSVTISAHARRALDAYHWPGNVRELKNMVERLVVLAGKNSELNLQDLPIEITEAGTESDVQSTVNRLAL